ncbi:c-type cytochrome [Desulfolithobacter sp.]
MRLCTLWTVILLALALTLPAWAGDNEAIFVQKCGSCHQKGGQAAPVNPADKAGLVWKKYFKRGRHPVDLTATITDADMASILSYLQDHAADSDHPVAAAIPK